MAAAAEIKQTHVSLDGRPHTRLSLELVDAPVVVAARTDHPRPKGPRRPERPSVIPNLARASTRVEQLSPQIEPEVPADIEHVLVEIDGKWVRMTDKKYGQKSRGKYKPPSYEIITRERDDRQEPVTVTLGKDGGFIIDGYGEPIQAIVLGSDATKRGDSNARSILVEDAQVEKVVGINGTLWIGEETYVKTTVLKGPIAIHTPGEPELRDKYIDPEGIEIVDQGKSATINDVWVMQGPITKVPGEPAKRAPVVVEAVDPGGDEVREPTEAAVEGVTIDLAYVSMLRHTATFNESKLAKAWALAELARLGLGIEPDKAELDVRTEIRDGQDASAATRTGNIDKVLPWEVWLQVQLSRSENEGVSAEALRRLTEMGLDRNGRSVKGAAAPLSTSQALVHVRREPEPLYDSDVTARIVEKARRLDAEIQAQKDAPLLAQARELLAAEDIDARTQNGRVIAEGETEIVGSVFEGNATHGGLLVVGETYSSRAVQGSRIIGGTIGDLGIFGPNSSASVDDVEIVNVQGWKDAPARLDARRVRSLLHVIGDTDVAAELDEGAIIMATGERNKYFGNDLLEGTYRQEKSGLVKIENGKETAAIREAMFQIFNERRELVKRGGIWLTGDEFLVRDPEPRLSTGRRRVRRIIPSEEIATTVDVVPEEQAEDPLATLRTLVTEQPDVFRDRLAELFAAYGLEIAAPAPVSAKPVVAAENPEPERVTVTAAAVEQAAPQLSEDQMRAIDYAVDLILVGPRRDITLTPDEWHEQFGLPVGATEAEQKLINQTFSARVDAVRRARQAARRRERATDDFRWI